MECISLFFLTPAVCYNQAWTDFMTSNPGKPTTIYHSAELSNKAFVEIFGKNNTIKGFQRRRIWPLNTKIL